MIVIPTEEQQAFQGSSPKDLVLDFPVGRTLTNSDIYTESMTLEQNICDESTLTFGNVYSSCFTVRIFDDGLSYKGLRVNPQITADNYTRSLGWYTVQSDSLTSDKIYRDLKCYDKLYDVLPFDYSEWHNSQTGAMTVKVYRDRFFAHIGIEQVSVNLPNDQVQFSVFKTSKLTGADIISAILQINGCFGYIGFDDKFKYIFPKTTVDYNIEDGSYVQGSFTYEDEPITEITGVRIKGYSDEYDEESYSISDAFAGDETGSVLQLEDNYLIHLCDATVRQTMCTNLLNILDGFAYQSASITFPPYVGLELGDVFKVMTTRGDVVFPVLHRNLKGISALRDTFEAKGENGFSSNASSVNNSVESTALAINQMRMSVSELLANKATIQQLNVVDGRVENLETDYVTVHSTLVAHAADIESLEVDKADVTDLNASNARIAVLETGYADISRLDAGFANIKTLLSGNAGVGDLQNIRLTTLNAVIDEAVIKNLVSQYITVGDLLAGTIDTSKFRIASPDNSIVIENGTQTWRDSNDNVRIQIGEDSQGDFTFVLYDATGVGVLIDETGLKPSAIADGMIKDAKIAADANIQASKIDIASLFDVINNDGSHAIYANKVYLNEQSQTLEQAFTQTTNNMGILDNRVSIIESGIDGFNVALTETQAMLESVATASGLVYQAVANYTTSDTVTINSYVYRGSEDIHTQFPSTWFSYHKKTESGITQIGTGYSITLRRSDYEYLGSVVCRFNLVSDGEDGHATDTSSGTIVLAETTPTFKVLSARDNLADGNVQLYYAPVLDHASNPATYTDTQSNGNVVISTTTGG